MIMLFVLFILVIVFLVFYLIYHRVSYFSRRLIPSPPIPSLIYGHLSQLWSADSYSEQLRAWTRQYGSVYGLFEGLRPVYVVSDMDFIQEVFVSQFARFCARRRSFAHHILGARQLHVFGTRFVEEWTRQRKVLNPTYTISKMKRLFPTLQACTDMLMEKLTSTRPNEPINIQELYLRLAMDIICRTGFGIETDVQNDTDNTNMYLHKMKESLHNDFERTLLAKLYRIMPTAQLANICVYMFQLKHWASWKIPSDFWLSDHIHKLVKPRFEVINKEKTAVDLFQLMIDAVHSNEASLTSAELFSNVFVLLEVGVETASTALGYCTYRLAAHPDIQENIYKEIIKHWSSDADYYDLVMNKLTNLDIFIREVFRMHPIVIQEINRECMEDARVNGYDIEKGSLIQVDLYSINFNQELWGPEPVDEFHPERHLHERHPLADMTFGAGPRRCLGMRFSLMEIKWCLTQLIKKYYIKPTAEKPYKLNTHEAFVILPNEVCVRLENRFQ